MVGREDDHPYPWCALPYPDPTQDPFSRFAGKPLSGSGAVTSDLVEPHLAEKLLSAGHLGGPDQRLRRALQHPAGSREHQQSDPG
jgi:hypothetical protein